MEGLLIIKDGQVIVSLPSIKEKNIFSTALASELVNFCAGLEEVFGSIQWAIERNKEDENFSLGESMARAIDRQIETA